MLSPVAALVTISLVGAVAQLLSWRLRLPAIVFLLVAGIALGPGLGWIQPDALFGDLLIPLVSLSVAIILFEGSLTLRREDLAGHGVVVRRMVTLGSVIVAVVAGVSAHYFVGFGWELSALFGALMTVTGPTVVAPMLRSIRPTHAVSEVLRWEGIVIDPLGALFTVIVFEIIVATSGDGFIHAAWLFGEILVLGGGGGLLAGYLLGVVLRKHWLPEYLINVVVLNVVIAVFALCNYLAEESGLLAVTVMGMVMANMRHVPLSHILDFKETLSTLLVSALFVILAARIDPSAFLTLGWGAVLVFLFMQLLGRPLKVALSAWGSSLTLQERILIAWVGPRGIVAAAIAAILALRLEEAGVPQADLMVPLVFSIIIATVVVQGGTARWLARALGVMEPEPRGVLIIGANRLARAVAKQLDELGFDTLLADSDRTLIRTARMSGLKTFYGDAVSEFADRRLDLIGMGRMLGLSPDPDVNALAAVRYRPEFGAGEIYSVRSSVDVEGEHRRALSERFRGQMLFDEEVSYQTLDDMLRRGAEVKTTGLTDEFNYDDYSLNYGKRAVPLFALDARNRLRLFATDSPPEPGAGWKVVSIVVGEDDSAS